jgi:hypothetical protein
MGHDDGFAPVVDLIYLPACPLHLCGCLIRLSQTIDPICPTEHDREEDEIDRHENVDAWWWLAVEAEYVEHSLQNVM